MHTDWSTGLRLALLFLLLGTPHLSVLNVHDGGFSKTVVQLPKLTCAKIFFHLYSFLQYHLLSRTLTSYDMSTFLPLFTVYDLIRAV